MQTKTIKTVISKKITEWLETITDENLRARVKGSLLVSGGCVASMYLNEPVNDYDVYLQSKEVAKALAEYYCKGHGIQILDGDYREQYIKDYEAKGGTMDKTVDINRYNSGLRSLKPGQIKLFMEQDNAGLRIERKEEDKYLPVFFSPNAISLTNDIQVVLRFNGSPEEIHKTFDFVHPTNYFTFADGLLTNKEAFESLLTKQLRYQGSLYPVTSIIRMKKFIKRGWNISAGEMLKIMFQVSTLDLSDPDVLEEQLIGVDVAYFGVLIEALRSIGTEKKIDSHYLNVIIDRVFNQDDSAE